MDISNNLSGVINDFNFIANPYWSPVDFNLVSKSGVYPTYWIWDPTVGKRGAYTSYTIGSGSSGLGSITKDIQPGQAIFVQTNNAGPTIGFEETDKSSLLTPTFRTDSASLPKITVKLFTGNPGGIVKVVDATSTVFGPAFSELIGDEDARKFTNPDENINISIAGKMLALEGRKPKPADTIAINIWRLYPNNSYHLNIDASLMDPATTAHLHDKYLNQYQALSVTGSNLYPFNFGADSASFYNRFQIITAGSITLSSSFIDINAQAKMGGAEVGWTIDNDGEISRYEVEHTSTNMDYKKIATVTPAVNSAGRKSYLWFHKDASNGLNYYRIKAIAKDGGEKYSKVATVDLKKLNQSIVIYPNPLKERVITMQMKQMQPGVYGVVIYNLAGQAVFNKNVHYNGAAQSVSIPLHTLPKGVYQFKLDGHGVHFVEQLIIQ